MMESMSPVCPVPTEQQPINEYQQLKESWFFSWATLDWLVYLKKLTCVWGISWVFSTPLAAASFSPSKYVGQFILSDAAGASLGVILALTRLYLGWSYVRSRLVDETVFYEESGWYDGQCWKKPAEILIRDRLIVSYQIQPILVRIQQSFGFLALFFGVGAIVWCLLRSG